MPSAYKVAGVDEAGRGPLAGPVVAAACVLPERLGPLQAMIADSKQLSPARRAEVYAWLMEHGDVDWAVARVEADEIDRINIRQATLKAMQQAVAGLREPPHLVLVDGRDVCAVAPGIEVRAIVRGDQSERSIGAASIIAKVVRDRIMEEYDARYPGYGLAQHKGYGTEAHLEAIRRLGATALHRRTFAGV